MTTIRDPLGNVLTDYDIGIIYPSFARWKEKGNNDTLQNYINNHYFSNTSNVGETISATIDVDDLKKQRERSHHIGPLYDNPADINWDEVNEIDLNSDDDKSIVLDNKNINKKEEEEEEEDLINVQEKPTLISKRFGNISHLPVLDDSSNNLPAPKKTNVGKKISTTPSKKKSFLDTIKNIEVENETKETVKKNPVRFFVNPVAEKATNINAWSIIKKYVNKNSTMEEIHKDPENSREFKNQLWDILHIVSTPKDQQINLGIGYNMFNVDQLHDLRNVENKKRFIQFMDAGNSFLQISPNNIQSLIKENEQFKDIGDIQSDLRDKQKSVIGSVHRNIEKMTKEFTPDRIDKKGNITDYEGVCDFISRQYNTIVQAALSPEAKEKEKLSDKVGVIIFRLAIAYLNAIFLKSKHFDKVEKNAIFSNFWKELQYQPIEGIWDVLKSKVKSIFITYGGDVFKDIKTEAIFYMDKKLVTEEKEIPKSPLDIQKNFKSKREAFMFACTMESIAFSIYDEMFRKKSEVERDKLMKPIINLLETLGFKKQQQQQQEKNI